MATIVTRAGKGTTLSWAEMDANLNNLNTKVSEIISVKDFGAVGDGVTDDTAAINTAITHVNSGYKSLHFPAGNYQISSALTPFAGNGISVFGDGKFSTYITSTFNGDIFSFDVRTADRYFFEINGFTLQRVAGGTYSSSCGLKILADVGSVTGLQYAKFANLRFANLYRGIVVQDTGKLTSGPFDNTARHGFMVFEDLISAVATDAMYECVVFDGGTGPHHTFIGGQIRGSNAAIRLGSAGGNAGIGDILFVGVHIVTAGVGLDIYGPSGGTPYNQNITITGCQFDNCSTATVRMDRMQNCRILPNNSTSSVGVTLTNCTNFISEDRNAVTMQGLTLQGGLTTTSSYIVDTHGTRYAQSAMARRSVNDDSLMISGGNSISNGSILQLFGGAHATAPSAGILRGEQIIFRNQANSVDYININVPGNVITIGNGAWNGPRLRLGSYHLWVDGSGRLRIKSSSPSSDTDGTIVGTQT